MRICLIGEFSGHLDEGMRILSSRLAEYLSKENDVKALDVRGVYRGRFWKDIRGFAPQIIHCIHGPTIASLAMIMVLGLYNRNARTIVSATHPHLPPLTRGLVRMFKPNLVLAQSHETERMFIRHGCRTAFWPLGVDTDRFKPVSPGVKLELRRRYGIDKDKFIVLHVGSVVRGRNISVLGEIQGSDNQVIIVGSTSTIVHQDVLQPLRERNCLVWRSYFDNIEEVYWLSDCYVFPTRNPLSAIELPLSVLEAMACNLPVISTPFGALPRLFQPGEGLLFAESDRDFAELVRLVKAGTIEVRTREKVMPYSWDNVVARLEDLYRDVVRGSQASAT